MSPLPKARVAKGVPAAGEVWPDSRLLAAIGANVGSRVSIGAATFRVTRVLISRPDQGGSFADLAPSLIMNAADLPATQLIQPGSRVSYSQLFAGERARIEAFKSWLAVNKAPAREDSRHQRCQPAGQGFGGPRHPLSQPVEPGQRVALRDCRRDVGAPLCAAPSGCGGADENSGCDARPHLRHQRAAAAGHRRCLAATHRLDRRIPGAEVASRGGERPAQHGAAASRPGSHRRRVSDGGRGAGRVRVAAAAAAVAGAGPSRAAPGYGTAAAHRSACLRAGGADRRGAGLLGGARPDAVPGLHWAAWPVFCWCSPGQARHWCTSQAGFAAAVGVAWRYGLANLRRRRAESLVQIVAFGVGFMVLLLLANVRNDLNEDWRQSLPVDVPNYFFVNIPPQDRAAFLAFLAGPWRADFARPADDPRTADADQRTSRRGNDFCEPGWRRLRVPRAEPDLVAAARRRQSARGRQNGGASGISASRSCRWPPNFRRAWASSSAIG